MINSFLFQISLFFFTHLAFGFDLQSKQNVALYWGQNSAGSQQSLGSYCESTDADIYLLSFLYQFPTIGLDFSNACTTSFSDGVLHCSQIAQDIQKCQSLGKKVLLSLGGASGAYGFSDENSAKAFAHTLWNTFGEGTGATERPFDSSIVDGFDFDIENNNAVGYAALVKELRSLFATSTKQYYISAAPQCPYPDASVGDMLENADVDFAFIQFYNNYCNVGKSFNWDTWQNYAQSVSPNKNIKLYLGLPGSATAASTGYISDLSLLEDTISKVSGSGNFGGVAMWDASQAFSNKIDGQSYVSHVKSILSKCLGGSSTTTLSPSSSTASFFTTPSSTISSSTTSSSATVLTTATTSDAVRGLTTKFLTSATASSTASVSTTHTDARTTVLSNNPLTTTLSTSSTVERTTLQTSAQPTTTGSAAYAKAVSLNALYASGKYNGEETCTNGDIACSANGEFAICNFGTWVNMVCASGTTCFASESSDILTIGCNFASQKEKYIN
ncbi:hypothetical protein HG536_0H04010 [Torulaspora globosa]|uniref:chitinase n=1 Tax=Torulaspora globosa TaxID=48254 RepID=A0A7G3ZND9_9SACH|nr:uncharacterized protein HG536_0H04010 [Torulaspora globosa]QLL35025.1 hypothetical protein HG536_0H04010 [Torulaspora globosa]